ncbi:hypothetical protein AnigIFM56816_007164 [Aspergillus niger]|nr:hypothetical protein AnigIFM56816_007164 [Aspergillus niger]
MPYVTDLSNPDYERKRRIMGCQDVTEKCDQMEQETHKWFSDLHGDWQNFIGSWPASQDVDEMRTIYNESVEKFLVFWSTIRTQNGEVREWLARALANFEATNALSIWPSTETGSLIPIVLENTHLKDPKPPWLLHGA